MPDMRTEYTPQFQREFAKLPVPIQEKFRKRVAFLVREIRHPSLHAKKYDEKRGIWQARVDKRYRFYFTIENDCYVLLRVNRHED